MNVLEEDERYAVPSLDEIKKFKRFDKALKEGRRSPGKVIKLWMDLFYYLFTDITATRHSRYCFKIALAN